MAEAKPADKAADKKKDARSKKADKKAGGGGFSARFARWFSAAGCASCLTAVFLMLLVVGVWIFFWVEPGNIPWRHSMSWWRIIAEVLLVIAIPLVLYQAIRLWLEGEPSQFPDIDFAWKAGLDALAQNGLSLAGAPLFLIVGSAGPRQEGAIMRAAGLSLRVHDLPEGPAPLHWYASPDGIYLFTSETCGLSSLAALLEKRRAAAMSLGETGAPTELPALPAPSAPSADSDHGTIKPGQMMARPAQQGGGSRGTIMLDQFVIERDTATAQPAQAAAAAEADDERESVTIA